MEKLLAQQTTSLRLIERALDNFKKVGKANLTAPRMRSRIESLQENWTQFKDGHAELLRMVPAKDQATVAYFKDSCFESTEEVYQTTRDVFAECLDKLVPSVNHPNMVNSTVCQSESALSLRHLPPIKLPPFSGQSSEWESFRDRFRALITESPDLSDFAKMHFLVSSLTGTARDVLAGLSVTADNFAPAWKALTDRYENKQRLIETHIASLVDLPRVSRESASELHSLRDRAESAISALKRLDRQPDEMVSDIFVYLVSQKLDPPTRRAWTLRSVDPNKPSNYDDLCQFISSRAHALEALQSNKIKETRGSKVTCATASNSPGVCLICTQKHFIVDCPQFRSKNTSQRRELVKKFRKCFNCLSASHSANQCKSKYSCRHCQKRHHSLLHTDSSSSTEPVVPETAIKDEKSSEATNATALTSVTSNPVATILPTAQIIVRSRQGRSASVRALLDHGSQMTFTSEDIAQTLRLKRMRVSFSVSGLNGVNSGCCRSAAWITITPRDRVKPQFKTVAYILKSLTRYVPRSAARSTTNWQHLDKLSLADPDPLGSDPIKIIVGADLYSQLLVHAKHGPPGQPGAIEIHFGWVLLGTTSASLVTFCESHTAFALFMGSRVT